MAIASEFSQFWREACMIPPMTGIIYKIIFPNGKAYIGKTTQETLEMRLRQHQQEGSRCRLLRYALRKYADQWTSKILSHHRTQDELDAAEIAAIAEHNTLAPNGYNLTTGGEGGTPSEETRKKLAVASKAAWANPVRREKGVVAMKKKWEEDPEYREKVTERSKAALSRPEVRAAARAERKRRYENPAERKKLSESQKRSWEDSETHERRAAANRKSVRHPEVRAKIGAAFSGKPKTKAHCKNISKGLLGHNVAQETRDKIAATLSGRELSPGHCANVAAGLRGKPKSEAHRAALSAASKGKPKSAAHIAASVLGKRRTWVSSATARLDALEARFNTAIAGAQAQNQVQEAAMVE